MVQLLVQLAHLRHYPVVSALLLVAWLFRSELSLGRFVFTTLAALVVFYSRYAFSVYQLWEEHFADGKRVPRKLPFSPSHRKEPPRLRLRGSIMKRVLEAADKYETEETPLMDVFRMEQERPSRPAVLRRASHSRASISGLSKDGPAVELDMDHVFVPFLSFLWANTFIGPNALLFWLKGIIVLKARQVLVRWGMLKMKEFDPARVAASLCLEGTLAMYYRVRHNNVAGFYFPSCPVVQPDGSFCVKDLLAIEIDLEEKKLVKARLDDKELTASQALTILWYNTISANHTKLHAYANWGVNVEAEQMQTNPFHARNSLVTVIYNYYGFTTFVKFYPIWKKMGLLSDSWDPESLLSTFRHGIESKVAAHPRIDELMPYSTFVNFTVKVRAIFLSEFSKHKSSFPGCDGEAMFIGTILHSLDHTCMEWNLKDPLWLDVDDPAYGLMAELGRIVRVGFVEDIPGVYFSKRFKGCGQKFFETVYHKAAKINEKLADHMDTCIIK